MYTRIKEKMSPLKPTGNFINFALFYSFVVKKKKPIELIFNDRLTQKKY